MYPARNRIIIGRMQRLILFALLVLSVAMAKPTQAQGTGSGPHGGGPPAQGGRGPHGGGPPALGGNGPHGGSPSMPGGDGARMEGPPGVSGGYFGRRPTQGRFRNYGEGGYGFATWYYPYWEEQPLEQYPEPPTNMTPPPVVVVENREPSPPAPAPVYESPKLIEVPQTKKDEANAKPQPPALFVLANGERIESRTYTLTSNSLQVEVDRQQRMIALSQLNLSATIAANRERGIDLQIPKDNAHIFLSF